MIRLLIGIFLVGFGGFLGYFFSKKYRKRKEFFLQMSQFNERFLTEITYYKRPISKFLATRDYKGEFDLLLQTFYASLQEESCAGARFMEIRKEEYSFLNVDERAFVEDYFQTIGKGNTLSQKEYFSSVKTELSLRREKSESECKKLVDLYVKLGLLAGLAVLIIIV